MKQSFAMLLETPHEAKLHEVASALAFEKSPVISQASLRITIEFSMSHFTFA
jgi:hypothetical protein